MEVGWADLVELWVKNVPWPKRMEEHLGAFIGSRVARKEPNMGLIESLEGEGQFC